MKDASEKYNCCTKDVEKMLYGCYLIAIIDILGVLPYNINEIKRSINPERWFFYDAEDRPGQALNLNAIRDTVKEIASDRARHGNAFAEQLKRYFK